MNSYSHSSDPCHELRNVLSRSLASLGCPHVPSLPSSTFLLTTNTNLKVLLWLIGEIDNDLVQRLQATRSSNSIGLLKDFFHETGILPRAFTLRLDEIFNSSSIVDVHHLSTILSCYTHKPVIGHNIQLALIEYLSELLVCLRNPPMTVHQDMWSNRDVLNMFEQLPIDETNLSVDSRILEYADQDQQSQMNGDDEETSSDLKDVFGQIRHELLSQQSSNRGETEFESIFTNQQIQQIEKQLQTILVDTHQFFKRLETGSSSLTTTSDHSSSVIISDETLQKLSSIQYLNEIAEQVRSNDRLFFDKIQSLFSEIEKENLNENSNAMTLQSQMMLARSLTHTLNNGDVMKKK